MYLSIAIVGTGPTGIYAFRALLDHADPLSIWLFEKGDAAGVGMPYSPETTTRSMLANIASVEIPPIRSTYLEWMERQPAGKLAHYGLDPDGLHHRQFTPRLLLGEYFRDQFLQLVTEARAKGHEVIVREGIEVSDILVEAERMTLVTTRGRIDTAFDRVILATGHAFPEDDFSRRYFPSPWSGLIDATIPPCRVGILGTSLSGIDAAMAIACQHGRFLGSAADDMVFVPDTDGLTITLMSWTGVLPEADFYCPLPYQPLDCMTDDALEKARASDHVLDRVFALFKAELLKADPRYSAEIALERLTADDFAAAYFAAREAHDPFRWARANLEEVEYNKGAKITVPWRYAILRMHEKVEDVVSAFSETDRKRFDDGLKKVFVDNYAAVPSESIRRVLALRDAGILHILALGETYDLTQTEAKTTVRAKGQSHVFDVFIDARGQKPLTTEDLPFPSLRALLLETGSRVPQVDEGYGLIEPSALAGRVWFGAIPYLMHDRPFVQGITAAAEIGAAIALDVRRDATGFLRRKRRRWA